MSQAEQAAAAASSPAPAFTPKTKKRDAARDAALTTLIAAKELDETQKETSVALMTAGGAQLLVAWFIARKVALPKDLVRFARELRSAHPLVWKPLQGMNFIGFSKACALSSLPVVPHEQLQNACTELAV